MNLFNDHLRLYFESKQIIKVISGLSNSNICKILKLVKVAEFAQASYIDVIANINTVKLLKANSKLPICVSSINPIDLFNCAIAGADIVEIGNFDYFYKKSIYLTPLEIIQLAKETRLLINNIDLCVTIPSYLYLHEQIQLAKELEIIGVNILQTEGRSDKKLFKNDLNKCRKTQDNVFNYVNLSSSSLSSTYALSKAVTIPIITSSSINSVSSVIATSYGASGVGIGSSINQYQSLYEMSVYIKEIRKSLSVVRNDGKYNSCKICFERYQKKQIIF